MNQDQVEQINEYMALLSTDEESILRRWYGVGATKEPVEQIAYAAGLSIGQIRKIHFQAVKKIRKYLANDG